MRAVTVRFPGMRATVLRIAQVTGVTEEELWRARERAAEERLAAAGKDLDAYRSATEDGLLPAMTTRSKR